MEGSSVMNRTSNTIRNIKFALAGQVLGIFISLVSRRSFVVFLSAEYLGLNGLFSNLLSMLSLAELGVGAAIVYSLYKPIAENNVSEIKSLMLLYKKTYTAVGIFILVSGCSLTPFLQLFIKEMPAIPNIKLIYIIFVVNSATSYFFTYKRSLITANQQFYIVSIYRYGFYFVLNIAQIIVLSLTRNFTFYLLLQTTSTLLENILLSKKADCLYPFLLEKEVKPLPNHTKSEVKKNVFAMIFHKIGGVIVFSTDNILISKLVGLTAVGIYSNYMMIRQALNIITGLTFQSVSASLGNLNVLGSDKRKLEIFQIINFVGAWTFGFCSICLTVLINPFISLWLGKEYLFSTPIVFWIVLAYYVSGMRSACGTARDVMGIFWYDRYKPLFEVTINIIASVILGKKFGVAGIMAGTVISTMTTCFWVEPLVLYRHGLHAPVRTFFVRYGIYTLITVLAGAVTIVLCKFTPPSGIMGFGAKLAVCAVVPNAIFTICYFRTSEFKHLLSIAMDMIRNR